MTNPLEELAGEVADHAAAIEGRIRSGFPADRAERDRLCAELHGLVERAARLQEQLAAVDGPVVRAWRFTERDRP
jgi:hypothetical protein